MPRRWKTGDVRIAKMFRPQPKKIPNRDELRLQHCRQLPCLVCTFGTPADVVAEHRKHCEWYNGLAHCDPHHVRTGADSGTGTRPGHDRVVPLSRHAHDEHDLIGAKTFCKKYNLDLVDHADRISEQFDRLYPDRKPPERKRRRQIVKNEKGWARVHDGRIVEASLKRPEWLPGTKIMRATIKVERG